MERFTPPEKQELSPEGVQRLHQAMAIHSAIWSDVFQGQNVIRMMSPDRRGVFEFRMPPVEQMLDFVRHYISCTFKGEKRVMVEAIIPARIRTHAQYNLVCRALLSHEFECNE